MAAFRKRNNKWQAQIRIKGQAPRTKSFITKRDAEVILPETKGMRK